MQRVVRRPVRVWFVIFFLVGGCTAAGHLASPPPPPAPSGVEVLLDSLTSLHTLTPEALRQEQARLDAEIVRQPGLEPLLRLAVLLSLPDTVVTDRARALELLQRGLTDSPPSGALRQLGHLVRVLLTSPAHERTVIQLQEAFRQARQAQEQLAQRTVQLQQQLQEARAEHTQHVARIAQLQQQLQEARAEQQRATTQQAHLQRRLEQERATTSKLRRQIEELRSIEKSLMEPRQDKPGT